MFGSDLNDADRLEVEKIKQTLLDNETLKTFAEANTEENYALEFGPLALRGRSSTRRNATAASTSSSSASRSSPR